MSFPASLLAMMNSTVLEKELLGFDREGEPYYTTGVTRRWRALVVEKAVKVRNQMGENVMSSHIAYVPSTDVPPSATSEFTFPDGAKPGFLNMEQYYDDHGRFGAVIYFGSQQGG